MGQLAERLLRRPGNRSGPTGLDANGASNKTQAWLQNALLGAPNNNYSRSQELFNASSVFTSEVGATPYSGDGMPDGDNKIIDQKYVLLCSNEAWMQFTNDPFVKENRPLAMNIINSAFKGPLWDTVLGRIERYPMRYEVDANQNPTITTPEVSELNPNAPDYGRTKPNATYSRVDSSPIEVAWLIGGKNYKRINSGPPPGSSPVRPAILPKSPVCSGTGRSTRPATSSSLARTPMAACSTR